ncbi:hypothetical protein [Verrucomicrobium sp. BvORR034]|uniref:hypothetical protein n=1 Tax=Verrucomicrobium sp. BvORR034 TaxID=1396418 RepID=UPI000678BA0C|nr:hypothetical protein [Verrucomicrobium sp. BvORR034]
MKVAEATLSFQAMPTLKVDGEVRTFAEIEVNGEKFQGVDLGNGTYARLADRTDGPYDVTLFHGESDHDISNLKVSVTGGGVSRLKDTEGTEHRTDSIQTLDHESITFGDEFLAKFQHEVGHVGGTDPHDAPELDSSTGVQGSSLPVPPQDEPPKPAIVPPPAWKPPVGKTGMSKFFSDLTTPKETRTTEKTSASLQEVDKTTLEMLKMLSSMPKGSMVNASKHPNFEAYMNNIKLAAQPTVKRGADLDTAMQESFAKQIKTLSSKELSALAEAFSAGVEGSPFAGPLKDLAGIIHKQIKTRQGSFETEARAWTDSLHKALAVHEGRLQGTVVDREDSIHKVSDSRESVSLAFRGLVQSFNRAMLSEPDPDKARAMVARVVGGLGTDGRKVLLEGLMEHIPKGTPLPLMKMALNDGPYPAVLDPDGTIAKAQARVRESANSHAAGIQSHLADLATELLADFGEDGFVDDAPKKPGTHKQEFLSHVMRFQALVDEYERAAGQFGAKLPEDFEKFKESIRDRLFDLAIDLAGAASPLEGFPSEQIPQLEKALEKLKIPSLNNAITGTQTARRKVLEDSFQAKLSPGIQAGVTGNFDGMVKGMLGVIDQRNRSVETALGLSSNAKFGHYYHKGFNVDLLGSFADPELNVAVRRHYLTQAIESGNLSKEDMVKLQREIQSNGPLIALLIVGGKGTPDDDVRWGRLTAEWLVTLDQVLADKTGVPAMNVELQTDKMKQDPGKFMRDLSPAQKQVYEDNFGYRIGNGDTVTPRTDRSFEQIMKGIRGE